MKVGLLVIGLFIVIPSPFLYLKQMKKMINETDAREKKKKLLFLCCISPLPLIGFACIFKGLSYFITS